MSKDHRFIVFRKYKANERPENEREVYYGWTHSKSVVLAFIKQRSEKKYKIQKIPITTIERIYGEDLDDDTMINYVELKSVESGEKVNLFITKVELNEAEKKIQRYFRDLSSLAKYDDCMKLLELVMNLQPYYGSALFFLGFRPPEIDDLFASADPSDDYSNIDGVEEVIDECYNNPGEIYPNMSPVGPSVVEDICRKVIYSLESFIKVLKDDM